MAYAFVNIIAAWDSMRNYRSSVLPIFVQKCIINSRGDKLCTYAILLLTCFNFNANMDE